MTADVSERSICVHSAPDDAWFRTEIEAIATGLLTESARPPGEDDVACLGPHLHALVTGVVRRLARQGEPFTLGEVYRAVERGNVSLPQGMTTADREPLLRRLNRVIGPSSAQTASGGDA